MKARIVVALLLVLVGLVGTACQRSVSIPPAEPTGGMERAAVLPSSPASVREAVDGAEEAVPAPTDAPVPTHVVVYYFHRTIRCETCLKFETLTERALRDEFAAKLASGRLAWRVMDFEEPGNETLTSKHDVFESSVVVSRLVGETEVEWKKLEDIWGLAGYEDAFIAYIQKEVGAYLGGAAHGE